MPIQPSISQVPLQFSQWVFFQQLRTNLIGLLGGLNPGFSVAADTGLPVAIPSAGTISVPNQAAVITGSAAIETISATGLTPGAQVTLIAGVGASWTVGTAGNVALARGAVTPGQAYSYLWNGTKWNPL